VEVRYSGGVEEHLVVEGEEVVFGLVSSEGWTRLTRDLANDLDRAWSLHGSTTKKKPRVRRVRRLRFTGHGQVRALTIGGPEHRRWFLHAADWFLHNQDPRGGWPAQVTFNKGRKKYPEAEELRPGWYGAMCQGQGISVLVRAHLATGLPAYLEAAVRAVRVFGLPTTQGGVAAQVLGMVWYQEYPTSPPAHILNGFIYGLLGLWDVASVQGEGQAKELYTQGLSSLLHLLPLFDSGSGTFYDLRHLTMKGAPKVARWDYHATHVNQLLTLATLEEGAGAHQLRETAERWRGYMVGQRAPHN